jgi:hypothetical protein
MESANNNSGKEVLVIDMVYNKIIGSFNEEISPRWNARTLRWSN